jgi:WD40 repeat protein
VCVCVGVWVCPPPPPFLFWQRVNVEWKFSLSFCTFFFLICWSLIIISYWVSLSFVYNNLVLIILRKCTNSLSYVIYALQVCALQWSTNYKEFISGHGYANNELVIWKYPSMTKVYYLNFNPLSTRFSFSCLNSHSSCYYKVCK